MKTALITGASRGIGKAIATSLAAHGYNTAICASKDIEALNETQHELTEKGNTCLSYITDVSDPDKVRDMICDIIKNWGHIDVLVNNAGISYIGLLQDMSYEDWSHVINTNLSSVFNTCHEVIPHMVKTHSGTIINISSMWGICGASCEVAYSASKGGVNTFTKALAKELAPSGIKVNALAPGVIDTQMNQCFSEEERQCLIDEIPAGRFGTAKEIGEFVYSLCESSPYLTGQVITFDGGMI